MLNSGQRIQILIALDSRIEKLNKMIELYKGRTDQDSADAVARLRRDLYDVESAKRLIADRS